MTKAGTGIETLTGANPFVTSNGSSLLYINGGEVALGNGGSLALGNGGAVTNTAISVASTGTFGINSTANGYTESVAGAVTFAAGSAFSMADGYTGTLTVSGAASLGTVPMTFDIGGGTSGTNSDLLSIAGAVTQSGVNVLTIDPLAGTTLSGTYTLITGASGGLTPADFSLANTRVKSGNTAYFISLTGNSTSEGIVIGASGHPRSIGAARRAAFGIRSRTEAAIGTPMPAAVPIITRRPAW